MMGTAGNRQPPARSTCHYGGSRRMTADAFAIAAHAHRRPSRAMVRGGGAWMPTCLRWSDKGKQDAILLWDAGQLHRGWRGLLRARPIPPAVCRLRGRGVLGWGTRRQARACFRACRSGRSWHGRVVGVVVDRTGACARACVVPSGSLAIGHT